MRVKGINSVAEAVKAGKVNKIYVDSDARSRRVREIIAQAKKLGIPIVFKKVGSKIEADISPIRYFDVEFLAEKAIKEGSFLLLLDSVQDPQNLGAVIRAAEFFGCSGVIIAKRRCAQVNETVVKASAGAALHTFIARVSNLANTLRSLKKMGFYVVGAELGGKDISDVSLEPPLIIVVGGEDRGISKPVVKLCDEIATIRSYGKIDSLNLSNAASIFMFEFRRRRK